MKYFTKKSLTLIFLLCAVSAVTLMITTRPTVPGLTLTMVDVNSSAAQGDAHLIEVVGGKIALIDAGLLQPARTRLVPLLKDKGIEVIDLVIISHPHRDHYEGLKALLEGGIHLRKVVFNLPDRGVCDRERPWGCDYQQILEYREYLSQNGVLLEEAGQGMVWDLGGEAFLQVLYGYDGVDTPVGKTDVNDLSLIMMLTQSGRKILFTGDLNRAIGGYLASHGKGLGADILKMPHHGTEGAAPDSFYAKVDPSFALVPAPVHLWCGSRSERMRNWLAEHGVPAYVNGLQGHVVARLRGDEILMSTEYDKASSCQ